MMKGWLIMDGCWREGRIDRLIERGREVLIDGWKDGGIDGGREGRLR